MIKIALFGDPDVGKTTFFTTLTGKQFKEHSFRTETLRHAQVGTLLFFDAPGHSYLKHLKNEALNMCDLILYFIDSQKTNFSELKELFALKNGPPIIVCINKWDAVSSIHTPLKNLLSTTQLYIKLNEFIASVSEKGIYLKNICDKVNISDFNGLCMPISAKQNWGVPELMLLLNKVATLIKPVSIIYQFKKDCFELYGSDEFLVHSTYPFKSIFKPTAAYYTCKIKLNLDKITRSDNKPYLTLHFDLPKVQNRSVYLYADTQERYDALYAYCKARHYVNINKVYDGNVDSDFIIAWSNKPISKYTLWSKSFLELVRDEEKYINESQQLQRKNLLRQYANYGSLQILSEHCFSYKKNILIIGAIARGPIKTGLNYYLYENGEYCCEAQLDEIQLNKVKHGSYEGSDAIAVRLNLKGVLNFNKKCVAVAKNCVDNFEELKRLDSALTQKIIETPGLGIEPKSPA